MLQVYNADELFDKAASIEKEGDVKEAAALYEKLAAQDPDNVKALNRLIILYRKLKEPKKELKHINQLIKVEESYFAPKKNKGATISALSKKINQSLGRMNENGKPVFLSDSLKKLEKRREMVMKKVKGQKV